MNNLIDIFFMLLATMGPIKVAIVFAEKTRDMETAVRRRIAIKSVGVATAVGLLFILAGSQLMNFFHFSIAALALAGGLILLIFSIRMVLVEGNHNQVEAYSEQDAMDMAVYPFGVPMMASPVGIIVLTVISANKSITDSDFAGVVAVFLVVMLINIIVLLVEGQIIKLIDRGVLQIAERILGILLAALAMQMLIFGLQELGLIAMQGAGH